MPASNQLLSGFEFLVYVNGQAILGGRSASLSRTQSTADTTSRASGRWGSQLATRNGWSFQSDELFLDDDTPYVGDVYTVEIDTTGSGGWEVLNCRLGGSLALSMSTADKTSTCSNGWAESFPTRRTWSLTTDARYRDPEGADSDAVKALLAAFEGRTSVPVRLVSSISGAVEFTGSAHVTDASNSANYEESAGYSFTLTGDGALLKTDGANLNSNIAEILDAFFAAEPDTVTVKMTTDVNDNTEYVGTAWITSLTFGFAFESEITLSATFTGTGELEAQPTVVPT